MNFCDKFREFRNFGKFRENKFSRKFLSQKFVHANFSTFKVFDAPIKTLLSNFQNFIWEKSLTPFGSETQGKGVQKFSILRWRHFWIMAPYEMKNLTQKIVGTLTSEVEGRRRCCSTSRLFSPFSQKREILTGSRHNVGYPIWGPIWGTFWGTLWGTNFFSEFRIFFSEKFFILIFFRIFCFIFFSEIIVYRYHELLQNSCS